MFQQALSKQNKQTYIKSEPSPSIDFGDFVMSNSVVSAWYLEFT